MAGRVGAMIACALVSFVAAAAGSPQGDPFSGTWVANDFDSAEQVTFTAEGSAWRIDLHDDRAVVCHGSSASATGPATVSGNALAGTVTITCGSGAAPKVSSAELVFNFDPDAGTLTDPGGFVWKRQIPPPTIRSADARVAWRESRVRGGVVVSGTVSAASELTLVLARKETPAKPVAKAAVSAGSASPFTTTLKLPPASLPGAYVIHVAGTSGAAQFPPLDRNVVVPAPPEGVVDRASISTRPGGRPVVSVSGPQRELWVAFHLAARPSASSVAISWIAPSGKMIGPFKRSYAETVESSIGSPTPLAKGVWRAVLEAKGKVVKRASVRLR